MEDAEFVEVRTGDLTATRGRPEEGVVLVLEVPAEAAVEATGSPVGARK